MWSRPSPPSPLRESLPHPQPPRLPPWSLPTLPWNLPRPTLRHLKRLPSPSDRCDWSGNRRFLPPQEACSSSDRSDPSKPRAVARGCHNTLQAGARQTRDPRKTVRRRCPSLSERACSHLTRLCHGREEGALQSRLVSLTLLPSSPHEPCPPARSLLPCRACPLPTPPPAHFHAGSTEARRRLFPSSVPKCPPTTAGRRKVGPLSLPPQASEHPARPCPPSSEPCPPSPPWCCQVNGDFRALEGEDRVRNGAHRAGMTAARGSVPLALSKAVARPPEVP